MAARKGPDPDYGPDSLEEETGGAPRSDQGLSVTRLLKLLDALFKTLDSFLELFD